MAKRVGDYDKDGEPNTANDREMAQMDTNGDRRVTAQERAEYRQKQESVITETQYDSEGRPIKTISRSGGPAPVEPSLSAGQLGFSQRFLDANPDVRKALSLAIENNWNEQQFVNYVETKTDFGRRTTASQAAYEIGIAGKDAEEWRKKIADTEAAIGRQATQYGITLTPQQQRDFAISSVRNNLNENDMLDMLAMRYSKQAQRGGTATGQVAQIADEIKRLANSYGVTMTEENLQAKVQQAIRQGGDWQSWVEGQRNVFRNQAKNLYPKVRDQFDEFTLDDLLEPYMNTASQMLGISRQQMKNTDTMWTAALNGQDGPMSQDEWIRTLKRDTKYGWTKTDMAKREMTSAMNDFLSLFGAA